MTEIIKVTKWAWKKDKVKFIVNILIPFGILMFTLIILNPQKI